MAQPRASDDDQEFYDKLKDATSGKISDESLEKANKALEDASKQSYSESVKEIQDLVAQGNGLDTRLLAVQNLVEKAKLPSQAEAKTLRNAYVELLWKSRTIAGTAKGAADDFAGDLLDLVMMDDVTSKDKISELKNNNGFVGNKGKPAKQQPKQFETFVTDLLAYGERLEKEIGDKDSEAKEKMDKIVTRIDAINKEIDELVVNVVTPIVNYLKLGAGAFSSLLSGSPMAAFTALLAAVQSGIAELLQYKADLDRVDRKRKELEAERKTLQLKLSALEDQQSKLGDASTAPSSINSIGEEILKFSGRMSTFVDSFSQVITEGNDIIALLEAGTAVTDPVFTSKIKLIKELFSVNSRILQIYASAPTGS